MRKIAGLKLIENNDLVVRYWDRKTRRVLSQRKRQGKEKLYRYPWLQKMMFFYLEGGTVPALKFIKETLGVNLSDAFDLLREVRGKDERFSQ